MKQPTQPVDRAPDAPAAAEIGEVNGRQWRVYPPTDPDAPRYPQKDAHAHTWQAWPCVALELDGYGGVSVIDPYTGQHLYAFDVFHNRDEAEPEPSIYDVLRRTVDALEAARFLDDEDETD